jgi:hypothetical protein
MLKRAAARGWRNLQRMHAEVDATITYRPEADPPTVVVAIEQKGPLLKFTSALIRIAEAEPKAALALSEILECAFSGLEDLLLCRDEETTRPSWPPIEATGSVDAPIITMWGRRDEWLSRIGLLEGLASRPGHQYLNGYASMDPIGVVVTYRTQGHY